MGRSFSVTVQLPLPLQVVPAPTDTALTTTESNHDTSYSSAAGQRARSSVTIELSHLPPVLFELHLPQRYPLFSVPIMIEVRGWREWLPGKVCESLENNVRNIAREQMEIGEGVLVRLMDWVLSGDILRSFAPPDLSAVQLPSSAARAASSGIRPVPEAIHIVAEIFRMHHMPRT